MTPRGEAPEGGWESLKVAELSEELESRGLPKSGKKAELVARLQEDDASGGAPEQAEDTSEEAPAQACGGRRRGRPGRRSGPPHPRGRHRGLCAREVRARRTPQGAARDGP